MKRFEVQNQLLLYDCIYYRSKASCTLERKNPVLQALDFIFCLQMPLDVSLCINAHIGIYRSLGQRCLEAQQKKIPCASEGIVLSETRQKCA